MLDRAHRITKDTDFETIFAQGSSFFTPLFVFRLHRTQLPIPRFGFVVSNKVARRANKRNLVKRRMRAAVQKTLSAVSGGADIIVIATQKTVVNGKPVPYGDIERTMLYGLQKLGVLATPRT